MSSLDRQFYFTPMKLAVTDLKRNFSSPLYAIHANICQEMKYLTIQNYYTGKYCEGRREKKLTEKKQVKCGERYPGSKVGSNLPVKWSPIGVAVDQTLDNLNMIRCMEKCYLVFKGQLKRFLTGLQNLYTYSSYFFVYGHGGKVRYKLK